MSPPFFAASWSRAWSAIGAHGEGQSLRDALIQRYAEPQRRYHTQQHLAECLQLFDEARALAQHAAEVELALWFHDAIYELRGSDNEGRSADWAHEALVAAGVAGDAALRVRELVLATRHDALPQGQDAQLLVDIDLSILGAEPARFAEYEQQIRAEYGFVPGFLFRHKRRAILQAFLDRPQLYATPFMHERFEAQARINLGLAIETR